MSRFTTQSVVCIALVLVSTALAEETLDSAQAYLKRGMERFRANQIAESIEDFDQVAEMDPASAPHLWQRGISHYYAERFADGRRQFESHRAVNPHDVENATWHFICVARQEDVETARKTLIGIDTTRDPRVPMAEVYRFYSGSGSAEEVLQAAGEAGTERARMYAHLYLGLYYEVAGDADKAREHLLLAAKAKLAGDYMHDVAQVHVLQREWNP